MEDIRLFKGIDDLRSQQARKAALERPDMTAKELYGLAEQIVLIDTQARFEARLLLSRLGLIYL